MHVPLLKGKTSSILEGTTKCRSSENKDSCWCQLSWVHTHSHDIQFHRGKHANLGYLKLLVRVQPPAHKCTLSSVDFRALRYERRSRGFESLRVYNFVGSTSWLSRHPFTVESWVRAPDRWQYIIYLLRWREQIRQGSSKPLYAGAIPARSTLLIGLQNITAGVLERAIYIRCLSWRL